MKGIPKQSLGTRKRRIVEILRTSKVQSFVFKGILRSKMKGIPKQSLGTRKALALGAIAKALDSNQILILIESMAN